MRGGWTERVIERVWIAPLVTLVNVTVSKCDPTGSALAFALIVAMTTVLAPAASEPEVAFSVTHDCVLAAVQESGDTPSFISVKLWNDGENGPPTSPLAKNGASGVTLRLSGRSKLSTRPI